MLLSFLLLFSVPDTLEFENFKINSDTDPALPFHNEEQVVVNLTDSANLVACWRDFRLGYRQVGIGVSFDGGLTWQDRLNEGSGFPRESDPGLTTDADGNIYLITLAYKGSFNDSNALAVFKSSDGGLNFDLQGYASLSTGNFFEDKELMACDRTDSEYRGNLYVTWSRFTTIAQIFSVSSSDGGESWTIPVPVSDQVGVQWPVPCVGKDGTYYIAWARTQGSNAILLDRSTDGGQTWGTDIVIDDQTMGFVRLDGWIGTFCFPAIDADITDGPYGGNLYVAHMDRGPNGSADIFFTKSEDGGDTWSEPLNLIGGEKPGNDQFHPWLVVDNTGIIHVAFYDQRNGIADDLVDLYYVYSVDGGETWTDPIRVSTVASKSGTTEPPLYSSQAPMPGEIYGEYIGLAAWNGTPFPVWTDCREDGVQNVYFGWKKRDTTTAVTEPVTEPSPTILEAAFTSSGLAVNFVPSTPGIYKFTLLDPTGRTITTTAQSSSFTWDVTDLPAGLYFVRAGELTATAKAVKLY